MIYSPSLIRILNLKLLAIIIFCDIRITRISISAKGTHTYVFRNFTRFSISWPSLKLPAVMIFEISLLKVFKGQLFKGQQPKKKKLFLGFNSLLYDPWVCTLITMRVHPSVCYQLVKMFITIEPHGIYYSHFAYTCMSSFPTCNHWHANLSIFVTYTYWFAICNCQACCGQLVKLLTTLEPYGIFRSNFAYSFNFILSSHPRMQTGGEVVEHHFCRSRSFSQNAHNS